MRIALSAAAGLSATALLFAGCGGGGGDSTSAAHPGAGGGTTTTLTVISPSSISKDEFVSKADQICASGDKATAAQIKQQVGTVKLSSSQLLQVGKLAASGINDEVQKIRALGAPAKDEEALNSILDAAESGANQLASNPQQVQEKGEPNADLAKADREATAYGFKVCGRG